MQNSLSSLSSLAGQKFRYSLDRSSKKHRCPQCEKKTFVQYIDTETGNLLPEHYGRCDREANCGYFLDPYRDGYAKAMQDSTAGSLVPYRSNNKAMRASQPAGADPAFIPVEVRNSTLTGYAENNFIQNLLSRVPYPFPTKDIEAVISLYWLGTITSEFRKGAVCFPFIDIANNIRAIQVKQFDHLNHTTETGFLHTMLERQFEAAGTSKPDWLQSYLKNETKVSCLFGEHLLKKYPLNPVALVEAPKTAIYGTLYFGLPDNPKQPLWLATYNLSSLKLNRCKVLEGRKVILFPDLSKTGHAFELWATAAKEFERTISGASFKVSDLLEKNASEEERLNGCDLADYLIRLDWKQFREQQPNSPNDLKSEKREESEALEKPFYSDKEAEAVFRNSNACAHVREAQLLPLIIRNNAENNPAAGKTISELVKRIEGLPIPNEPMQINQCSKVHDAQKFVHSHLNFLKRYPHKRAAVAFFDRLEALHSILTT